MNTDKKNKKKSSKLPVLLLADVVVGQTIVLCGLPCTRLSHPRLPGRLWDNSIDFLWSFLIRVHPCSSVAQTGS
jgi:hypothetical protein